MSKELRTIDSMPITKQEIETLADNLISPVLEGETEAVPHLIKIKGLSDAIKKAIDDDRFKDAVLTDIEKYGKERAWNGAVVKEKEIGVSYDFSGCDDPIYNSLVNRKKELDKEIKKREEMLKNLDGKQDILDTDTGEYYTIYPAVRMSRLGFTVTFKK